MNLNSLIARAKQSSTSEGTGNFELGEVIDGFEAIDSIIGEGESFRYEIDHLSKSEFEIGIGNVSGDFLVRYAVITSSNGGELVGFSPGPKQVSVEISGANLIRNIGIVQEISSPVRILSASVVLTDDQIKALPTTPVEIVGTPGVGRNLFFVGAQIKLDAQAGVYDNLDVAQCLLQFQYGVQGSANDASNFFNQNESVGIFNYAGISVAQFGPVGYLADGQVYGVAGALASYYEDKPLIFMAYNGGAGDFTDGNVANSMKVTVVYLVLDV